MESFGDSATNFAPKKQKPIPESAQDQEKSLQDRIDRCVLECRKQAYSYIGVKGGKEGYDPSNTFTQNFAKGSVDAIIDKVGAALALGEIKVQEIIQKIQSIDWKSLIVNLWKSLTHIPENAYEFGQGTIEIVIKVLGITAVLDKALKIIEKGAVIKKAESLANRAEKARNISSLGMQLLKDRFKEHLRNHPNPKIQKISEAIQKIIQFQRDKIHPNAPEYIAISTALTSLSVIAVQKLDQCEACTLIGDEKGKEENIIMLAKEVDKIATQNRISLI
ncbi:MAG: hypothetical protein U0518_02675 [Candidatus Gracilibacteria bacterium]